MAERHSNPWRVFLVFLRLGLTSFGGPIAHLAYFRDEFVTRRRWIGERAFADLIALCQFLPGPASSQVGMALGFARAGYAGSVAAWAGFTLPSAAVMLGCAVAVSGAPTLFPSGLVHGLKIVAVAVVALAVWGMAVRFCANVLHACIALAVAGAVRGVPDPLTPIAALALAAVLGLVNPPRLEGGSHEPMSVSLRRRAGGAWLSVFAAMLVLLPWLAQGGGPTWDLVDGFFRAGSLVFGGGHVVLPLLQNEFVATGRLDSDTFLAGYGVAQAVPGPLFAFAAYVGAAMPGATSPVLSGLLALAAIFAPSFLLIFGALPFWERLRGSQRARGALSFVNAAVVGLLLAALYDPVSVSAIHGPADVGLAAAALIALTIGRVPSWLVVIGSAGVGAWFW